MFIPSLFAIVQPYFAIFPIVGFILIILQFRFDKKFVGGLNSYNRLNQSILRLQDNYENKSKELDVIYYKKIDECNKKYTEKQEEFSQKSNELESELQELRKEIEDAKNEILKFNESALEYHYNFSDYDGIKSEECRNKLALLKAKENKLLKYGMAIFTHSSDSKKKVSDSKKQIIRCFNCECDNALINLSTNNINSMKDKVVTSFETLNKIFEIDGVRLSKALLKIKLEELDLTYTYALKKEQEEKTRKEIKSHMIEEEKVRKEIERQKRKIEKDQKQYNNEIRKLMICIQKTQSDIEKSLYIDKVNALEEKLSELEKDRQTVLEYEANVRAGFVYVISNIGAFGEDVYKIGMTRRPEPMDCINELNSAAVPFDFDVHAMIFSDDAPALENILHQYFMGRRVNRVNLRKEFFRVPIEEIEEVVKENYNGTVQFVQIPNASEYRMTLEILENDE